MIPVRVQTIFVALCFLFLGFPADVYPALLPPFSEVRPNLAKAFHALSVGKTRETIVQNLRKALDSESKMEDARRKATEEAIAGIEAAMRAERKLKALKKDTPQHLVACLIDSSKPSHVWRHLPGSYHADWHKKNGQTDAFDQVLALGEKAMPALIDRLDDPSYTRIVMRSLQGDWPYILGMNHVALCLIEKITGCYFTYDDPARCKAHVRQWWSANKNRSRLERMKWQFPHSTGIAMEFMFKELKQNGEEEFLKAALRRRYRSIHYTRLEARLLAELGEYVAFQECEARLTDERRVVNSDVVLHLNGYGGKKQFQALADTVRRALAGNEYAKKYFSQIFLT